MNERISHTPRLEQDLIEAYASGLKKSYRKDSKARSEEIAFFKRSGVFNMVTRVARALDDKYSDVKINIHTEEHHHQRGWKPYIDLSWNNRFNMTTQYPRVEWIRNEILVKAIRMPGDIAGITIQSDVDVNVFDLSRESLMDNFVRGLAHPRTGGGEKPNFGRRVGYFINKKMTR